jgi:hypothetical protein
MGNSRVTDKFAPLADLEIRKSICVSVSVSGILKCPIRPVTAANTRIGPLTVPKIHANQDRVITCDSVLNQDFSHGHTLERAAWLARHRRQSVLSCRCVRGTRKRNRRDSKELNRCTKRAPCLHPHPCRRSGFNSEAQDYPAASR